MTVHWSKANRPFKNNWSSTSCQKKKKTIKSWCMERSDLQISICVCIFYEMYGVLRNLHMSRADRPFLLWWKTNIQNCHKIAYLLFFLYKWFLDRPENGAQLFFSWKSIELFFSSISVNFISCKKTLICFQKWNRCAGNWNLFCWFLYVKYC